MPRRNSRTSTASCSTSPSTTGGNTKEADAHRCHQGADDRAVIGHAELEHQLRRHDRQRDRGAYRCEQETASRWSAWRSIRSAVTATAGCCASVSFRGSLAPIRTITRMATAASIRIAPGRSLMKDEKPGGHGERCGAVGLIDAALWDLAAKTAGEPLWSLLARRHGGANASAKIAVYASGGHYRASNDIDGLCDDVRRAIGQGHRRFKIKIGGASLASDIKRIEAVFGAARARHESRGRRQRHLRSRQDHPISRRAHALSAGLDRGAGPSARLRAASRHRGAKPDCARDRREPVLVRRRSQSSPLRGPSQGSRHPAIRHLAELRHRRISAHPRAISTSTAGAASAARRMPDICWR